MRIVLLCKKSIIGELKNDDDFKSSNRRFPFSEPRNVSPRGLGFYATVVY
jgi:hypothetical protein